ncbi:hypothetical protein [Roseospira visakhapatnamensis]|uniref:Uncharacterized protein n=1 Tax=Roseospira visakhapatnamensis TaxID=390880 RepID=A0A7W6RE73_9PROT|nr:hypothetical protein [Roseospira visakhapatnamensis]MBB4266797.1 hypothetical protein [Roseospira visakhapatnamensis]
MITPDPPQSVPPPSPEDLSDALKKLLSVVTTAHRLIQDRQAVDLTGLDRQVADLCEGIAALPAAQARAFAPSLETLVAALDGLETASRDFMEARAWLWRGPAGITPMRRFTDAPPAGVVSSAYTSAGRAAAAPGDSGDPAAPDHPPADETPSEESPTEDPPPKGLRRSSDSNR